MHAEMHLEIFDDNDVICTTINCFCYDKQMLVYEQSDDIHHMRIC